MLCMPVLPFVSDDQHRWIICGPLHVLSCRASPYGTALIVTPKQQERLHQSREMVVQNRRHHTIRLMVA